MERGIHTVLTTFPRYSFLRHGLFDTVTNIDFYGIGTAAFGTQTCRRHGQLERPTVRGDLEGQTAARIDGHHAHHGRLGRENSFFFRRVSRR